MNKFWTVVGFTVRNKLRAKSFLITTLIMAIIMSIGVNLPAIISLFDKGDSGKTIQIGYVVQADDSAGTKLSEQLKSYFASQEKPGVEFIEIAKAANAQEAEKALKAAIADKKIKGYLSFGEVTPSGLPSVTYKSEKMLEGSTTLKLESALRNVRTENILKDAGVSEEQKAQLFAPVAIESVQIAATDGAGSTAGGKDASEQGMAIALVTIIILILFFAIMVTGQMIASEITSEKSSRVMEVLITSVAPLTQMFGKIFGVFIVGLSQIIVYVLVIVANASMPHNSDAFKQYNIDLSTIDPMLLVYALIYYLAGYFLYSTLYAAVGSIVSRTEDLGQAVMPITLLSMAGFYIATFSLSNPDSMLVTVGSYVPFFSPFVMMLRIGLSNPPVWQVLTSLGILFVSIYLAGWLSAKIYRTGVLMYGKRPSWKELRKAMKAYKI
ncbi:ABC transporter permease [Paenibacillus radicis (ex Gao et al. 2016)]|uniref:ABC-2 type transporter transmembrane domain-containing protein n=1 Tax=Paenibacillus radicis (ex Gao et al. 2016) TaxID=1737354 RepID=A0A917GZ93_9BACL|nr:ABC transporter permease [Paenibacillus radicis (ex Gao et al. 2016)]GGG62461.1 hypothetical protein GCM10010918_15240 [Paenibacillus radicis (ex Gao et al. 2016)]